MVSVLIQHGNNLKSQQSFKKIKWMTAATEGYHPGQVSSPMFLLPFPQTRIFPPMMTNIELTFSVSVANLHELYYNNI